MVPEAPQTPAIAPYACGPAVVCLSMEDTVKLAEWARGMEEVERAVAACSLVTRG